MMMMVLLVSRARGGAVSVGEGGCSRRRRGGRGRGVVEGEVLSWCRGCAASEGHRRRVHHCCLSSEV